MKAHKIALLSLVCLTLAAITAQAAQLASAKVVGVTGTVTKYSPNGGNTQLKTGDILKEGDSVSVTALSEAKLVFSNGSELTIEENTSVDIAKLQQESFSGGKSYEQLQADPSKSQTLLELNFGKLSGHVKKLQNGSQFNIQTPLGTAAIRGTKWSALLIYNAERGEFLLTVKNYDGEVDIISKYIGDFDYGEGLIGDKNYISSLSEADRERIPKEHTAVVRINKHDPYFNTLFQLIKNYPPTGPKRVITPSFGPGLGGNDDFGIIVVSPEGPQSN